MSATLAVIEGLSALINLIARQIEASQQSGQAFADPDQDAALDEAMVSLNAAITRANQVLGRT